MFRPARDSQTAELISAENGLDQDGRFLVRRSAEETQFVLTAAYKGQVTHHKLVKEDKISKSGVYTEYTVNGKDTGCRTLHKTIEYLTQKREPWWPLALTSQVMEDGTAADEPGAQAFYENTGETGDWKKDDADEATDPASGEDGGPGLDTAVDIGGGEDMYTDTADVDSSDFGINSFEDEAEDAHPTTLAERLQQLEKNRKKAEVSGIKKRQDSIKVVSGEIRRRYFS